MSLNPPRWKNGPPICEAANLPAFESKQAMNAFRSNLSGGIVIEEWQCTVCGQWHYWGVGAGDPAGASSGTTRSARHIDSVRERFLKSYAAKTMP